MKVIYKILAQYAEVCRIKVQKLRILQYSSLKKGFTLQKLTNIDETQTSYKVHWIVAIYKILTQYVKAYRIICAFPVL